MIVAQHGDEDRPEAADRDRNAAPSYRDDAAERVERRLGPEPECDGFGAAGMGTPAATLRRDTVGPYRRLGGAPAYRPGPHLRGKAASDRRTPRSEEGRHPVQGVVEDGLEAVAQARDRSRARRARRQRHRGPQQVDPGERVATRPTGAGPGSAMAGQWAIRASVRSGAPGGWSG